VVFLPVFDEVLLDRGSVQKHNAAVKDLGFFRIFDVNWAEKYSEFVTVGFFLVFVFLNVLIFVFFGIGICNNLNLIFVLIGHHHIVNVKIKIIAN
jgi:hypothetical protein